ncbi:uncharacterized protein [Parasteatoda tepidariorum]|uniref:uncharacterized protein n=1 Tax=Parasteatoda tepidariorum TaxID=114398 RepID=UPI001C71F19A|nr:uncharacterized protein LOC122270024 [Parasteatoda tepidariorum]
MKLHKWCTSFDSKDTELGDFSFDRNSNAAVKTLGTLWNNKRDTFLYKVAVTEKSGVAKRDVLSQIARLYDPLGLLGPVISKAKTFMQRLWLHKLYWNEKLPSPIAQEWTLFIKALHSIETIQVPSCVLKETFSALILHSFADASEKAFGAVIYLQTVADPDESFREILCSKPRVAPIKTMTIPVLELSASLLLSKLVKKVLEAMKLKFDHIKLWSDSTIALAWINTSPHLLKTFVSNRVSQIRQLTSNCNWGHVYSEMNPADIISRGSDATTLGSLEVSRCNFISSNH